MGAMESMLRLVVESWIWYGVVVLVAAARFISRTLTFGSIKKLQADDWIMAASLTTYTTFLVTINIVRNHNSNLLPPNTDVNDLSAEDFASRVYGSKMVFVVEICQCVTIWASKACLLIMYYRLTIAMKENYFVKALAAYTAFSFVFMMIFYLGVWCRPITRYWALPTQSQCSAATNHLITNAVFNLSSDILVLIIALQMFVRSRLPLRRKLLLCGIFGLGAFVILAAVLNKYYSFTEPYGSLWTYWYVRESSTALLVANLPYTWTLLRRIFKLRAFNPENSGPSSPTYVSGRPFSGRKKSSNGGAPSGGSSVDGSKSVDGNGGKKAHTQNQNRNSKGSENLDFSGSHRNRVVEKDPYALPSPDPPFSPTAEQVSAGLAERVHRDYRDEDESPAWEREAWEDPGGLLRDVERAYVPGDRA